MNINGDTRKGALILAALSGGVNEHLTQLACTWSRRALNWHNQPAVLVKTARERTLLCQADCQNVYHGKEQKTTWGGAQKLHLLGGL